MKKITYTENTDKNFFNTLRSRINEYFASNDLPKTATQATWIKAIAILAIYPLLFAALLIPHHSTALFFLNYFVIGFWQLLIIANISHDAAHNCFSKSKRVNQWLTNTMNIVGSNGYIFKMRHVYAHHSHPNIHGKDIDTSIAVARFADVKQFKWYHRYQYLMPFLFPFALGFAHLFLNNFVDFARKEMGNKKIGKHPLSEYVILFVSKFLFFSALVFLPMLFSGFSWQTVLLGMGLSGASLGFFTFFILAPTHFVEELEFPVPDAQGNILHSWVEHQLKTTSDYMTQSKWFTWMFGAFNHHVAHHLFQGICYSHYPAMTKIIQTTCKEHGITYHHADTMLHALKSHFRLLIKSSNEGKVAEALEM